LAASPVSSETADIGSSKRFAGELQICNAYFLNVSQCFADKSFARKLGSKSVELNRVYSEQASLAGKNAFKIRQATGMTTADLSAILMSALKGMSDDISGNCNNVGKLIDKWGAVCKQLVENPSLRLKQLSECPNEGKLGC
jgi:hypothetical protein